MAKRNNRIDTDVIALAVTGLSQRAIAEKYKISQKTVALLISTTQKKISGFSPTARASSHRQANRRNIPYTTDAPRTTRCVYSVSVNAYPQNKKHTVKACFRFGGASLM